MKITLSNISNEEFVKRLFYLMYTGAGREFGMGVLQARKSVTEEDIYKNITTAGDYTFGAKDSSAERDARERERNGEFYGDYIFGRMVKFGCKIKDGVIEFYDRDLDPEYQGWAVKYPTVKALIDATVNSFSKDQEVAYKEVE